MSLTSLTGHLVALTLSFLSGRDCVRVTSLCVAFTKLKSIPLNLWGWTDEGLDALRFHTRSFFVLNLSLACRIGLLPHSCKQRKRMYLESPRFVLGTRVEVGGTDFNVTNFRILLPTLKKVNDLLITISPRRASTMGEQLVFELLNMLIVIPNLLNLSLRTDERFAEPTMQTDNVRKSFPKIVSQTKNRVSCCLRRLDMRVPFLQSWHHMEIILHACPALVELDVSSNELVTLMVGFLRSHLWMDVFPYELMS